MVDIISPTREQLQRICQNDLRLVRAFELLFANVSTIGSLGLQDADSVDVSGGKIDGVEIGSRMEVTYFKGSSTVIDSNGVDVGGGNNVKTSNVNAIIESTVDPTNGAAAGLGTITNAPHGGNPVRWLPIKVDGVVGYVPWWT